MASPFFNAQSGNDYVSITTATTTTAKTGYGYLGTLVNAGTATSGNVTVYDNTAGSGTILWQGTLTAGQVLPVGIPFKTGLTVVTAAANTIVVTFS